ncbi:MAG: PAS domain S-box protein [bacterium]
MAANPKSGTWRGIMLVSLAFWLLAWVVDSLLDHLFFYKGDFLELLILDVPAHEVYVRLSLLFLFVVFGIIASVLATRHQRAGQELRENEENLRITLNSIGDAVIATDTTGRVVRMNPIAERLTGWNLEQARGRPLVEVFHIINGRTREQVESPVQKVLDTGLVVGLGNHTVLISADGGEYQIADSGAPIRDEEGRINGVVLVFRDVTEDYRLQEDLQKNEQRYRGLFNSIRDAILVVDTNRNIIDCNPAFTDLFGYELDEIKDLKTASLYESQEEYRKMGEMIGDNIQQGSFFFTINYRKKSGEVFPGETNVFYLRDGEGNIMGFFGLVRDVTEQRKARQQLSFQAMLLNQIQDMVTATDLSGRITYVNDAECRAFKKTADEMVGNHVENFGEDPERGASQQEILETTLAEGEWRGEVVNFTADGKEYVLDCRTRLIHDESGEAVGMVGISTDVTERKHMEEALEENRDMLQMILEATGDGILCGGVDGSVIFANQRFAKMWKIPDEVMQTGDRGKLQEAVKDQLEDPESFLESLAWLNRSYEEYSDIIRFKDGRVFERYSWPVIKGGEVTARVFSYREITERVKAEKRLSRRLELERIVSEISSEFVGLAGKDTDQGINRALASIGAFTGADRAYVFMFREGWAADNTHEWCEEGIEPQIKNLKGVPINKELPWFYEHVRKMQIFHVPDVSGLPEEAAEEREHFRAQAIKSLIVVPMAGGDEVIGFLGFDAVRERRTWSEDDQTLLLLVGQTFTHALSRKRSEEALKQSEAKYRLIAENTADVVWSSYIRDGEYKNIYVSPAIEKARGYTAEEHLQQSMEEILTPESLKKVNQEIEEVMRRAGEGEGLPETRKLELDYTRRDGGTFTAEVHVHITPDPEEGVIWITGVTRDITERKQMEAEQQRTAKLESLGVLAGGLAHDFNNILQALWGNLSLLSMREELHGDSRTLLAEAENACRRATGLTRQLLTFARGGEPVTETASVKHLINEAVKFYLRGSNVMPVFNLPGDLLPVTIDPQQISQVVQNLVINADHAMPEGGKLEITARNLSSPPEKSLLLEAGRYVAIKFEDHGTGIPEEYIDKIFDPYFTTKQKGSGLGLATAYSIVRRHQGHIEVSSLPGRGTAFTIYLPASSERETEEPAPAGRETPPTGKKVLVMDDDDMVRDIAARYLEMRGHEMRLTSDGSEALQVYRKEMEAGTPFDLVMLDLTVPGGMGGKETLERLLEIDPQVKAVVASGYSNDPIIARHREYGFMKAVKKPFTIEDLDRVMSEVFGEDSSH